ncbi:hypothetical protein H0H92_012613 [Tricholoma furcatifolium]|nr:hypothetical protein H0H92_012613 [Tricholoma furcatifolium]
MGSAPPLSGSETPYEFGYATLIVSGAQRLLDSRVKSDHLATLKFLISRGLPLDIPDIAGLTALHHIFISSADQFPVHLLKELLKAGANVNAQNKYGEVPLLVAYQKAHISGMEMLLEYGADLDIKDGDGISGGLPHCLMFGPQVAAIAQKWLARRRGEEPPRAEKRCDKCGAADIPLKNCAKCRVARYCTVECQRAAWPTHKSSCVPFSTSNTVTVKPFYMENSHINLVPFKKLQDQFFGVESTTPESHHRPSHVPKNLSGSKDIVIKVQLPFDITTRQAIPNNGNMLVYTKKRDLVCQIRRSDGPAAYDRLVKVIGAKGPGGSKAYFVADLKSKDELIIKVSEVLAVQPF